MTDDMVIELGPTQEDFVHSDAEIAQFIGPMGEGKTYAAIVAMMAHAQRLGRPIRAAAIRDTHQNMKTSTVPSIRKPFSQWVTFHDDFKIMRIHSHPMIEVDLFGANDDADLQKLQGPEYDLVWLEEPAPIIEKANAGIPYDVFTMAVARAARGGGAMRVQITQNPSDETHWTAALAAHPEIFAEKDGVTIRKKTFRVPYGENKFLSPIARAANEAAFKDDPGKYARYVEGVEAPVQMGKPVLVTYNGKIHFAAGKELPVIPGAVGVRMWDGWHNPVCIIGQHVPPGRLLVHEVLTDEGIGVRELARDYVLPALERPKYRGKIGDFRDIGDPSMRTPDQSTSSRTAARTIEDALGTRFEPGPTRLEARLSPARTALSEMATDGQPKILLSATAFSLHRSLNGGWHWKTDNSGNIIGTVPEKDHHSHLGDAFTYGCAVLFPNKRAAARKPDMKRAKAAAMSYGPGRKRGAA